MYFDKIKRYSNKYRVNYYIFYILNGYKPVFKFQFLIGIIYNELV